MTILRRQNINEPRAGFGELKTAERTLVFDLRANVDVVSELLNVQTGNGNIAITSGEYELSTQNSGGSSIELQSAERGRYIPGYGAEIGIAVRVPTGQTYTGDQEALWGYFDSQNGFGYGIDATGVFVFLRKNGSDTKVYQPNWNVDKLDGTGESGITLDVERGNIYQAEFTWYGYGNIELGVVTSDSTNSNEQKTFKIHRFIADGSGTTFSQPNLPVTAKLNNGATATQHSLFVAGRQYSIIGKFVPKSRFTAENNTSVNVGSTDTYLMGFQQKNTDGFESITIRWGYIVLSTDQPILVRVVVGDSIISGASFGNPSNATASETAIESDTAGSFAGGGITIIETLATGSFFSGDTNSIFKSDFRFSIPSGKQVAVLATNISTAATVSTIAALKEEW